MNTQKNREVSKYFNRNKMQVKCLMNFTYSSLDLLIKGILPYKREFLWLEALNL